MSITHGAEQTLATIEGKAFLRVGEAAAFLSVSRWTIYRWVEEGRLRGTKIGKSSLRIFCESIVGLVERNKKDMTDTHSKFGRS